MLKITLSPLDSVIAEKMAERRGVNIAALVSALLREEAVIEVAGWRPANNSAPIQPTKENQPVQSGQGGTNAQGG